MYIYFLLALPMLSIPSASLNKLMEKLLWLWHSRQQHAEHCEFRNSLCVTRLNWFTRLWAKSKYRQLIVWKKFQQSQNWQTVVDSHNTCVD